MSVLLPETRELLRSVRAVRPLFSNQILAELFDAKHTRGPFKVYPRTVGGYVVVDQRLPMGSRTVEVVDGDEALAHQVLEAVARGEGAAK